MKQNKNYPARKLTFVYSRILATNHQRKGAKAPRSLARFFFAGEKGDPAPKKCPEMNIISKEEK